MASFNSGTMHTVSLSSSCSSHKRKLLSSVKKKTAAVLKKAMTEKSDKWKSRDCYGTTTSRWQQPAGNSGGRSSHDTWEHAKPKGKWKEVSAEFEAISVLVKEKKITWNTSGSESATREADFFFNDRKCGHRRKERRKGQRQAQ